jgi:hypothetical protein
VVCGLGLWDLDYLRKYSGELFSASAREMLCLVVSELVELSGLKFDFRYIAT